MELIKKIKYGINMDVGIAELTDLWIGLDYPADSPHIIQGRGNNISPRDYYTKKNYDKLYAKNTAWLETELSNL